jgi:hypothetical protein
MNDKRVLHKWAVGKVEGGKWLAVSSRQPYFCFEGNSIEEVDGKANRALDYYFGCSGKIDTKTIDAKRRTTTITSFSRRKIVEREHAD